MQDHSWRCAMNPSPREPLLLFVIALAALAISAIHPHDRLTWVLEVTTK